MSLHAGGIAMRFYASMGNLFDAGRRIVTRPKSLLCVPVRAELVEAEGFPPFDKFRASGGGTFFRTQYPGSLP